MAKVQVQLKIRPEGELSTIDDSEIPGLISDGFLTEEAAAEARPAPPPEPAAPKRGAAKTDSKEN
jgi:hypothetical protein